MQQVARYGYAGILALWGVITLIFIQAITIPWVFFVAVVLFFAFAGKSYLYFLKLIGRSRLEVGLPLISFLSFLGLVSVIEELSVRIFLTLLAGLVLFFLGSFSLYKDKYPSHSQKPIRRVLMMIWVFTAYSLLTSLFALNIFFPLLQFWAFTIFGGLIMGYISFMVWRMYMHAEPKQYIVWTLIIALILTELIWVMHLLPFGYLALGLLTTWIWYIIQLLLRFHFGPSGIVWKRQRWFLLTNIILFVVLLIFGIRWI